MKYWGKIEQICKTKLKPPPRAISLHRDPYDTAAANLDCQPFLLHKQQQQSRDARGPVPQHRAAAGLPAQHPDRRQRGGHSTNDPPSLIRAFTSGDRSAPREGRHIRDTRPGPGSAAGAAAELWCPLAARHGHRRHLRLPRGESAGRRVSRCGRTACSELPAPTALQCLAPTRSPAETVKLRLGTPRARW